MEMTDYSETLREGEGKIVWYEDYYTYFNEKTKNLIYEIVPPFIILENGKEIPFESTEENTRPISIIMPPFINAKPASISVKYYINKVFYCDDGEEGLYLNLELLGIEFNRTKRQNIIIEED